ncbi:MAG TPA: PA2817 family protein [Cellvibrionaceae bacterium]
MSSTAESSARVFHHNLLKQFIQAVQQQPPFILDDCEPVWLEYLSELEALPRLQEPDYSAQGQALLCRSIAALPHLTPLIPRDLLWHFGGDCLHYMPDEEIAIFQQLDERCHEAQSQGLNFNYEDERAKLLGLH